MKRYPAISIVLLLMLFTPVIAGAHCDAEDGPVASAARKALDERNVNLVLPYVPAEAEVELTTAFERASVVREKGPEARALADRYFMEAAVRLHRAGERAPYTGLKPAGTDFGPVIPAAEKALESGKLDALLKETSHAVSHGIGARFEQALARKDATREPTTRAGVAAARERVRAELDFIGYVEQIYRATKGAGHTE